MIMFVAPAAVEEDDEIVTAAATIEGYAEFLDNFAVEHRAGKHADRGCKCDEATRTAVRTVLIRRHLAWCSSCNKATVYHPDRKTGAACACGYKFTGLF